MTLFPNSPSEAVRSPFWRVVQLIAGVALFFYPLRLLAPMPFDRFGFVFIAALLTAGEMAVTDSLVGVIASVFENLQKGRHQ